MLLQPAHEMCKRCVCRVRKGVGRDLESTGPCWGEGTGLDVAFRPEAEWASLAAGALPPTVGSCAAPCAIVVTPSAAPGAAVVARGR